MAIPRQAGFTLIELMLALAISSSLLIIAFIGQRGLRAQAAFDASVTKVVASIADAHNEATAGVNTAGTGDGSQSCSGTVNPALRYVFAGVAWSVADTASGATFAMDFFKASRTAPRAACVFETRPINVPSTVRLSIAAPPAGPVGATQRVLFVRDTAGGLSVCNSSGPAASILKSFLVGGCAAPTTSTTGNAAIDLYFSDSDNHRSQIQIDPSGLAKRIN